MVPYGLARCAESRFGDGLYYYAADTAGSDIERHPESFTNQPGRHYPKPFIKMEPAITVYANSLQQDDATGPYNKMYSWLQESKMLL